MRAMYKNMPGHTPAELLRDQAFQVGLIPTETINPVRPATTMVHDPSRSIRPHSFRPITRPNVPTRSDPDQTINPVRAAPTMAYDPSCSIMELDRVAQTMGNMIPCNRPRVLCHGCSEWKRSGLNDPLLARGHIERYFAFADVEAHYLLPNARAEKSTG